MSNSEFLFPITFRLVLLGLFRQQHSMPDGVNLLRSDRVPLVALVAFLANL